MKTYKLFRVRNGRLYPLYVEADKEVAVGKWLKAQVGEKVDETHVKAKGCGGKLSLRPGWHSTTVPFTNWIGKKTDDGTLIQRKDTVWCECEVSGNELEVKSRHGSRVLLKGWYKFKTNAKQKNPWIISDKVKVIKKLNDAEVSEICKAKGITPQRKEV